ncbi:MAG: PilZ domain-containing protein [Myxococcota bacterium]|nr:PilZ domain-containing protein [Deltaproteobacteria bacterium]MDQ3340193.1 PilZ domain-containing protein [Myxococcota bacterium]
MSRRSPRYRADLAVTVTPLLGGERVVCRIRDVSGAGLSLGTTIGWFPIGTRISLTLFDEWNGNALEMIGDVVREATEPSWILGILLIEPPAEWHALVASAARVSLPPSDKPAKRLRVLVVGDDHRQRGAMALYVTSGWDILFASDEDSIAEAVQTIQLDAVVAELDDGDPRIPPIMQGVRRVQPGARRIVRGEGRGTTELVHRFVARDAGLEALLDAMTADIPVATESPKT